MPQKINSALRWFAKPGIFSIALAWLMVLLVVGTIAQKDIGLYEAQHRYFSCFFFWMGPVPLPGGYPAMALVFFGLVARLVALTRWDKRSLGINIVHLGALALLFGGFLTAAFSMEGSMSIVEGAKSSFISDYHRTELAFTDERAAEADTVIAFADGWLEGGKKIAHATLPFTAEVLKAYRNVDIRPRAPEGMADPELRGFAKNFEMVETAPEKDAERNRAGILFRVSGAGEAADGVYMLVEHMQVPQTFAVAGGTLRAELRRARTPLPFEIELVEFEQGLHPGTRVASSYSSDVVLVEGKVRQPVRIEMNQPFRHMGYTFYQASFVDGASAGKSDTTVLAVVWNVGRLFPYVSSLIMSFGLLLHLFLHMPRLMNAREGA